MGHPNGIERAPTGQKLPIFCHTWGPEANRATQPALPQYGRTPQALPHSHMWLLPNL